VLPEPDGEAGSATTGAETALPASDGGNAPAVESEQTDLGAIREDLQRRSDETGD
jgi:hypothetical protein